MFNRQFQLHISEENRMRWKCSHLVESLQLLLRDSDLCRHFLELDLQIFEVDLVSIAEFLSGRHFAVEAVDAVLRLGDSGLKGSDLRFRRCFWTG